MMRRLCRVLVWGFAALYALALLVYAAGTFGWFGAEPDPLSGIYLIVLGQPWIRLTEAFPERTWPVVAALAPAVNLAILYALCRNLNRRNR